MSHSAKHFKTACIQYECKEDNELENELSKVILSCQMADSELSENKEERTQAVNTSIDSNENDDRSIYIKARSSNIFKKINQMLNWFNEFDELQEEKSQTLEHLDALNNSEKSRRFFVMSVCISGQILGYDNQNK